MRHIPVARAPARGTSAGTESGLNTSLQSDNFAFCRAQRQVSYGSATGSECRAGYPVRQEAPAARCGSPSQLIGNAGIVGDHGAAITAGAKIFSRIEAEACDIAHGSGSAAEVTGAMGLSRIFNNPQIVA